MTISCARYERIKTNRSVSLVSAFITQGLLIVPHVISVPAQERAAKADEGGLILMSSYEVIIL